MKNLISITLVVILCATILLGMSNFVSAATTGNSLPDNIDFGTGYSLPDNWDGASNATISNGEMKLAATGMISRSYTPVTSGNVIYSFDFDTTDYSSNTTTFAYPVYVHLGNSSSDAAKIEIRGTNFNRVGFFTTPIVSSPARGKYSMKIIANLDASPKTYDVYVYNSEKTLIGSQLTSPFTAPDTSSIDRIAFKAYDGKLNSLRVDNISVNRYTVLTNPTPSIADQTQNVSIETTTLTYTFNNPIDATTLSGISISPTVSGSTYALDPQDEKIVIYTFPQGLKAAKTYTVIIPTTVKDIYNQSLNSPYTSSFTTVRNSMPDFIDFNGSYSLDDNWDGASNATIENEQMKISSIGLTTRGYMPITSGNVVYNFDYDTTGMNTDQYFLPINIYLGDGSNPYAVGIYIRGTWVDIISPNTKILDTTYYGKYSMRIIVNLDATPKTYDVYVYNQSNILIGSLLNQTYSTTSFDRISFKNYSSTNSNYLLVDNISVNR